MVSLSRDDFLHAFRLPNIISPESHCFRFWFAGEFAFSSSFIVTDGFEFPMRRRICIPLSFLAFWTNFATKRISLVGILRSLLVPFCCKRWFLLIHPRTAIIFGCERWFFIGTFICSTHSLFFRLRLEGTLVSCVVQFSPLYVGQLNRSTGNAFFSMTSWVQAQVFSCELVHVRIFLCRRATKSSKLWCKGSLLYRVSKRFLC